MPRRRRNESDTPADQDSFLDIVANLVGILIILIVVVGSQIGESLVHGSKDSEELNSAEEELSALEDEYDQLASENTSRDWDHHDWNESIAQETQVAEVRRLERDLVLRRLAGMEARLEVEKRKLSEQQKRAFELQSELARTVAVTEKAKREIEAIQYQQIEEVVEPQTEVIEHFPTPIAKTVFGEEVHFQLKQNRIVYAPLNELVQRLKETWDTHADEIPPGERMIETLGPIADFRLQYELFCEKKVIPTAEGAFQRVVVSVDKFSLLPVRQLMGEEELEALQEDSEFHRALRNRSPERTTVSVWVYPDSYATFLEIRKHLIKRGYQVAVWPLTEDQYISGGPDGMRSSAQ